MRNSRYLIIGALLGAWASFFLFGYMITQEFNPAWENSPIGYKQLRDEIKDAVILFPMILLGPITIIIGLIAVLNKIFEIRISIKNKKN